MTGWIIFKGQQYLGDRFEDEGRHDFRNHPKGSGHFPSPGLTFLPPETLAALYATPSLPLTQMRVACVYIVRHCFFPSVDSRFVDRCRE